MTSITPPTTAPLHSAPEVALPWLVRLRWVAVLGQTVTICLVWAVLEVDLPWFPLLTLIAITNLSNVALWTWLVRAQQVAWQLLPAVLILDTLLFTALLYFCGGPENPFALLYVIHIAMATVTLNTRWTWFMVVLSTVCYGALFWWHVPLSLGEDEVAVSLYRAGTWFCLMLVAGVMAYFVGRVMSALRQREQQLTSVRTLAARNERLASLTTLATGAAHELGTPLGTIAVVARELELAAEKKGDDAAMVDDARLIRQQVDRCRVILDRMSASADEAVGKVPERVPLDALLRTLRTAVGEGGEIVELEAGELTSVDAPRLELEEALVPLLENALHATEGSGPVRLGVDSHGGQLTFTVSDGGPGMDAGTLARAGEPFYTTKPPGKGTGLGLHLVRLVAERLGGTFELQSTPGTGTVATLKFPAAKLEEATA